MRVCTLRAEHRRDQYARSVGSRSWLVNRRYAPRLILTGTSQTDTHYVQSHIEVCDRQPWTCPACLSLIPGESSRSAHTDKCPDTIVPCTHLSHGCSWTGRRTSLHSTHIPTCPYESIKGFFAIHEARSRNLEEENAKLKHQISVMQGMMSMMQRELSEVKRVLGAWFREDGGDGGAVSPVVQYAEDIAGDMAAFVDPSPDGMPRVDYLSLASYFPPAEDEYAHPESSRASTSTSPAFRPRPPPLQPSQAPQSQPPLSSTFASTVAPLTISPTLHGTLTSLHSSVVSLATSLESLGRHQDVALTTEAMRMGEEVRGLRAVVSGLRMQVHAIMVDRSGGGGGREAQPGPVLVGNLPQHPGGEQGPWPPYFGMPRFPTFVGAPQGVGAGQQPVTKL